jgi:hypothetical protein
MGELLLSQPPEMQIGDIGAKGGREKEQSAQDGGDGTHEELLEQRKWRLPLRLW